MRKRIYIVAVFVFGFTLNSLIPHAAHILVGFIIDPSRRGETMNGLQESYPYNLISLIFLLISLGFIVWYILVGNKKDKDENEKQTAKIVKQTVQETIKELGMNKKPDRDAESTKEVKRLS